MERGSIYNLTLAEAETCIGILAETIKEKDQEIARSNAEETRVKVVLDVKDDCMTTIH